VLMNEIFESPKERILEFITANPASHLRKIKSNLCYSMGTIQYYLTMLEKEGKIKFTKTRFYKNYYSINESDEKILSIFNLNSPRSIVMYLIQHESATHQDITRGVGLSSSTISWHMKRLIELQVVQTKYSGKYTMYSLTDRNHVLINISKYKSIISLQNFQ